MTEQSNASGAVAEEAQGSTTEGTPKATPAATGEETGAQEVASIPKARFDEINEKRKAAEAELAKYRAESQKIADEAAKKAGDVETAQKERDSYKAEAEAWTEYANEEIERLTADFSAEQKELFDLNEGLPLARRLRAAQKLAAMGTAEQKPKGFGTNGGKAGGDPSGVIPPNIRTLGEFHEWFTELSQTPAGRKMVADQEFNRKVNEERIKRFK